MCLHQLTKRTDSNRQVGLDPAMVSATVQERGISPTGWTGSWWILSNPALFSGDCRGKTGKAAEGGLRRPAHSFYREGPGRSGKCLCRRWPNKLSEWMMSYSWIVVDLGHFLHRKQSDTSRCFAMLHDAWCDSWWVSTSTSWIVSLTWETLGVCKCRVRSPVMDGFLSSSLPHERWFPNLARHHCWHWGALMDSGMDSLTAVSFRHSIWSFSYC